MRNSLVESETAHLDLQGLGLLSLPLAACRTHNLRSVIFLDLALPVSISLQSFQANLDENKLKVIPAELGYLSRLTRLSVEGNQLATLPPTFSGLLSLQSLHLRRNPITTLPMTLGLLTSLTSLEIDIPGVLFPPKEILGRTTGEILDFLKKFVVAETTRTLCLDEMDLATFPVQILALTNLTMLSVRKNRICALPAAMGEMQSLQVGDFWCVSLACLSNACLFQLVDLSSFSNAGIGCCRSSFWITTS